MSGCSFDNDLKNNLNAQNLKKYCKNRVQNKGLIKVERLFHNFRVSEKREYQSSYAIFKRFSSHSTRMAKTKNKVIGSIQVEFS